MQMRNMHERKIINSLVLLYQQVVRNAFRSALGEYALLLSHLCMLADDEHNAEAENFFHDVSSSQSTYAGLKRRQSRSETKCRNEVATKPRKAGSFEQHRPTSFVKQNSGSNRKVAAFTGKERDEETGLYYYGARYLDAKYSRWLSADPALNDYIPVAPIDDEAKKHNSQLPGQGGVFNLVNLQLYHYAGNNPVKYVEPDGREEKINWFDEISECVNDIRIGFQVKWGIKKGNLFSLSAELNLSSRGVDKESYSNDKKGAYSSQGGSFELAIGNETIPLCNILVGVEKKYYEKDGVYTPFDLLYFEFEPKAETKGGNDLIITPPIPCVGIDLNISETIDLVSKATISFSNYIKNLFFKKGEAK